MKALWWVLLLASVTACGGAKKDVSEPTAGKTPAPIVALMELTLTQEGRPIARLHADGHCEGTEPDSSGKPAYFVPGPTLRADGMITLSKLTFTARVDRDGQIYVVTPASEGAVAHLFGRITGNEFKLENSSQPWTVRVEGDTLRFNGSGLPNRIEGKVDDRVRHTVLVMAAAFFIDMSTAPH